MNGKYTYYQWWRGVAINKHNREKRKRKKETTSSQE